MKKIIACFVLENGTYVEVPVDAVIENGKFKEEYAGRFFYPFNQYLLEMSKEDRRYFYLCREVMKEMVWQPNHGYNKKNRVEVVSLDELVDSIHDGTMHADILSDEEHDVAEQVEKNILLESIRQLSAVIHITLFRLNLREEPLEKLQARNLRLLDKPATAQNMR